MALLDTLVDVWKTNKTVGSQGGRDWKPRNHRELWTTQLRFDQDSLGERMGMANRELTAGLRRQNRMDFYMRSKAMRDAIAARQIRSKDFQQTLGMNELGYHQQYGMNARSFVQNQLFNQSQFSQNQYLEGMRLHTETAGRAGQRGLAKRQELQGMFPEASPWDLMGTSQNASAGQAVLPGYPSASSANNAAGPSPAQQLRAHEVASAEKIASMLMPTPAVKTAQIAADAQKYSAAVHAMSGLGEALINAQAPGRMATIAGRKADYEGQRLPSDIELNRSRAQEAIQSGAEKSSRYNVNQQEARVKKGEADSSGRYYRNRADYEGVKPMLGVMNAGATGLGVGMAANAMNKLGKRVFSGSGSVVRGGAPRSMPSGTRQSPSGYSTGPMPRKPTYVPSNRSLPDSTSGPSEADMMKMLMMMMGM